MRQVWLLLGLRSRLAWRRVSGRPLLVTFIALGYVGIAVIAAAVAYALCIEHERQSYELSQRLFDLTSVVIAAFLVLGPLMGLRTSDLSDVTKLFAYPIRPRNVVVSTVLAQFTSGNALLLAPILLVPAWLHGAADAATSVAMTLLFLYCIFTAVQCLRLAFVHVLRSRIFRDLVAVLAPAIGLGSYFALRTLLGWDEPVTPLASLEPLLEEVSFEGLVTWLPPLWYSRVIGGELEVWRAGLALSAIAIALSTIAVSLTQKAFFGEIQIEASNRTVSERRGLFRRALSSSLPAAMAAVYEKEARSVRREPWLRMLFLQQIVFVVLLSLGQRLLRDAGPETSVMFCAAFLLFTESGLLQNVFGIEGAGLRQSFALPLRGRQIVRGKSFAHAQILLGVNLLLVPLVAFVESLMHGNAIPWDHVLLMTAIGVVALPVVLGLGSLISVLLPHPVGPRSRRALGQDRGPGDGCLSTFARIIVSMIALVPTLGVALIVAWPRLAPGSELLDYELVFDRADDLRAWGYHVPVALVTSIALWAASTRFAGYLLDRSGHKLAARLAI